MKKSQQFSINLFNSRLTLTLENKMQIAEPTIETQPETKTQRVSREYLKNYSHVVQLIVIERTEDQKNADVTVIDRHLGIRYSARLPVNDMFELVPQSLERRFHCGGRTETVEC